jgi:hypothetical protein
VVGLPGTGKSLLTQQLAHLAELAGRRLHLLQWDVARPVFEANAAGRRYPVVDGVTQPMIRVAVGLWARRAVAEWNRGHAGPEHLLIAEAPFVGGRLIELARPATDDAEPLLTAATTRFAIALPSRDVRRTIEAERERRVTRPMHPREREDAPPPVLRELWRELHAVARRLGISNDARADAPYDPDAYRRVYETVLRRRPVEVIRLDTVLPTAATSVYDVDVPRTDLVPSAPQARAAIADAERCHPNTERLARGVERWWDG